MKASYYPVALALMAGFCVSGSALAKAQTYGPCGTATCTFSGYATTYVLYGNRDSWRGTAITTSCRGVSLSAANSYLTAAQRVGLRFVSFDRDSCTISGTVKGSNKQWKIKIDEGYSWSRTIKKNEKLKVSYTTGGAVNLKTILPVTNGRDPEDPGW